mmetsp:Transcript_119961/g.344812  ORF Transcript_119961/g.344812 Transcript_119961/m.344812 type:complete len:229 (-) Transcript_119961:110-796(-)
MRRQRRRGAAAGALVLGVAQLGARLRHEALGANGQAPAGPLRRGSGDVEARGVDRAGHEGRGRRCQARRGGLPRRRLRGQSAQDRRRLWRGLLGEVALLEECGAPLGLQGEHGELLLERRAGPLRGPGRQGLRRLQHDDLRDQGLRRFAPLAAAEVRRAPLSGELAREADRDARPGFLGDAVPHNHIVEERRLVQYGLHHHRRQELPGQTAQVHLTHRGAREGEPRRR